MMSRVWVPIDPEDPITDTEVVTAPAYCPASQQICGASADDSHLRNTGSSQLRSRCERLGPLAKIRSANRGAARRRIEPAAKQSDLRSGKIATESLPLCKSVEHDFGEEVDGWEYEQQRVEAVEEASVAG